MPYSINPQEEQESIAAFLREQYPGLTVIEDGLLDDDNEAIQYDAGGIKSFVVLWFSNTKRSPRGRSFAEYKLDDHYATVDVVVVSRSGTKARKFLNDISDRLTGFKAAGGGRLHKGAALWADSRQVVMDKERPSRWARTDRFDFAVASKKTA